MPNTNFQTIFQMPSIVNNIVKQATGRESVSQIDMDFVTVGQDKQTVPHEIDFTSTATFVNNNQLPLTVLAKINPVQDLHGYDNPWPAGGGVNLFPPLESASKYDVSISVDADGTITINGTASQDATFSVVMPNSVSISEGDAIYINAFNPVSGDSRLIIFAIGISNPQLNVSSANASTTFTATASNTIDRWRLLIPAGVTFTNFVLKPMFKVGGDAPTSYVPYSNICPITGWTGVTVTQSDGDTEDTYTITFPEATGTVYGGVLNVTTGVLTITDKSKLVSDLTWTYQEANVRFRSTIIEDALENQTTSANMFSSFVTTNSNPTGNSDPSRPGICIYQKYVYIRIVDQPTTSEDFLEAYGDERFVYKLKNPITVQLTPTEIDSLIGENNLSADTGDISVSYTSYIPVP